MESSKEDEKEPIRDDTQAVPEEMSIREDIEEVEYKEPFRKEIDAPVIEEPEEVAKKPKRKGRGGVLGFLFRVVAKVCILFTVFMLVLMYTPVANFMASTLTVPMILKKVDLTVVLGGGGYPNSVLSHSSSERLLHGLRLHNLGLSGSIAFVGGTTLDATEKLKGTVNEVEHAGGAGLDVIEASLMKSIAEDIGVSSSDIILDIESSNTYLNIMAVKAIMDKRGFDTCMIVTSPTHMVRAMKVVRKQGLDCTPAPVGDHTAYVDDPVGRLWLMRSVLREYGALIIYKVYGYI